MGVAEKEELVDEVVAAPNPDRAWEPGEHPDPFAFAESPCSVVAEPFVSDDGIQKPKGLVVLDWDVAVPDDAEHVAGVAAYDSLPLRNVRAIESDEWLDRNAVIESRGDDCFTCRDGGVETGAESMPRHFPRVHHRGLGIGRSEVGGHEGSSFRILHLPGRPTLNSQSLSASLLQVGQETAIATTAQRTLIDPQTHHSNPSCSLRDSRNPWTNIECARVGISFIIFG